MEIKKLQQNEISDFRNLVKIFKVVFEIEESIAENSRLGTLLSNPDFLVFVVKQNNHVIGGLTIYILHRYFGSNPVAYIYDVGIIPEFQGRGFGKKLIAEACQYCKENGFKDAFVQAEIDDIDAVNFYRKTRFSSEMNATHFTYSFSNDIYKDSTTNR